MVQTIGLIAIREVSPPFGQLRAAARPRSNNFLTIVRLFLCKERRQLWNITVNRYITRNSMQVQFIRFRQKISPLFRLCFIQCNIAHSRFAKRQIQSRTHNRTFRTVQNDSRPRVGACLVTVKTDWLKQPRNW